MRSTFAPLLILSLVACPLMCGQRHAGMQSEQGVVANSCCCRHDVSTCPTEDPSPGSPSPSGQSSQCICGGAVFDISAVVRVGLDWGWSLPVVIVEQVAHGQHSAEFASRFAAGVWPDVGMNRGRVICCLYCTFLC